MPLSEHEQRLFEQIERSLAEDPKFASAVRATDPRFHARRRVILAGVLFLGGIAVLIFGAMSQNTLLGVLGFVVMLSAAGIAMHARRRAQGVELTVVGGTASRSTRPRKLSMLDRLEERWKGRPENLN